MVCYTSQNRIRTINKEILNVLMPMITLIRNEIVTHSYKKKNSKQLLDFIQRVNSLYDFNVKPIFLVLDTYPYAQIKEG
jgi:hypothetical protein